MECLKTLHGHKDRVWQVAASSSAQHLATGSADHTVAIYDHNFAEVARLKDVHARSTRTVAWKPGQPVLAVGSFDATLSVWAWEDPKWELLAQLEGHENEVKRVAWSASGQYLASCSRDKSVWVWEVDEANEDFECVAVLQDHTQDVKHVVWHPDPVHEILASTSYDDSVRLYRRDDDEWLCVADLQGHECTVWGGDFDPNTANGLRIATCADDGSVRVWKRVGESGGTQPGSLPSVARWDTLAEDWVLDAELPQVHTSAAYAVKWSKHGLASVGADGRLVLYRETPGGGWSVHTVVERAHGVCEVNTVTWFGNNIVTGGDDNLVKLWAIRSE